MNWINRLFNSFEQRTSIENPQTPLSYPAEWLLDIFNGGRTDSGIRVSEMTALQVGTVFACVNTIANGVASLPLQVYERLISDNRHTKKVAHDHNLYPLLHDAPNTEMTTHTWIKTLMCHSLLWGNGYCEIQRDGTNQIIGIWPRNPARTRPIRNTRPILIEGDTLAPGTLIFETMESLMSNSDPSTADNQETNDLHLGTRRLVLAEDMIHVPGLSLDGRLGQGTVYLARQIMGLALATEKYGAKFFGNGARPAGILTIPNALEDKAVENLRRSWAEAHGGENQFKVAVLEKGVEFAKIASTPDEGQMNATRQYQRTEIAAVFGVPLHMVAANDKGGGKSNVEQQSIEFVLYCLNPWLNALEQEFARKIFPKVGRSAGKYFAKFDVRRLLYPSADSRAKFYASGKQWGYLSSNDIRELEDMNPIDDGGGDLYWAPVNMQPATMPVTGGPAAKDHLTMKSKFAPAPKGPRGPQPSVPKPE
jgi:HK97 family phage portal protein